MPVKLLYTSFSRFSVRMAKRRSRHHIKVINTPIRYSFFPLFKNTPQFPITPLLVKTNQPSGPFSTTSYPKEPHRKPLALLYLVVVVSTITCVCRERERPANLPWRRWFCSRSWKPYRSKLTRTFSSRNCFSYFKNSIETLRLITFGFE